MIYLRGRNQNISINLHGGEWLRDFQMSTGGAIIVEYIKTIKIVLMITNTFGIVPNVDLKVAYSKIIYIGKIMKNKLDYACYIS